MYIKPMRDHPLLIADNDNDTKAEQLAADAFMAAWLEGYFNPEPTLVFRHLWAVPDPVEEPITFRLQDDPFILDYRFGQ